MKKSITKTLTTLLLLCMVLIPPLTPPTPPLPPVPPAEGEVQPPEPETDPQSDWGEDDEQK